MRKDIISLGAFLLFLASLPLLSIGTFGERPSLWVLGLVFASIAGLIPSALRFVDRGDDDDGANGEQADGDQADGDHARDPHDDGTHSDDVDREANGADGDRRARPRSAVTHGFHLGAVVFP